jgi:hypothetical protein
MAMLRTLTIAMWALAAACSPPAQREREPTASAPASAAWVAADGPGEAFLSWQGPDGDVTLICRMKCEPTAAPAADGPQPSCAKDRATFFALAAPREGGAAAAGDAATLFIDDTAFTGTLVAQEVNGAPALGLSLPISAEIVAALDRAQTARMFYGDTINQTGPETSGQLKQFAASCAVLGALKP